MFIIIAGVFCRLLLQMSCRLPCAAVVRIVWPEGCVYTLFVIGVSVWHVPNTLLLRLTCVACMATFAPPEKGNILKK